MHPPLIPLDGRSHECATFCSAVRIGFGMLPAIRASRLDPIEVAGPRLRSGFP